MTRKETCTLMRLILKAVAENNDIVYLSSECSEDCTCDADCKKIQAESRWVLQWLDERKLKQEPISLAGQHLRECRDQLADPAHFSIEVFCCDPFYEPEFGWEEDEPVQDLYEEEPAHPEDPLSMDIGELNLSVRAYNSLARFGVRSVGDITQMTMADFAGIPNLNDKAFDEIVSKLNSLGLDIKRDE